MKCVIIHMTHTVKMHEKLSIHYEVLFGVHSIEVFFMQNSIWKLSRLHYI